MDIIHKIADSIPRSVVLNIKYFSQYINRVRRHKKLIQTNKYIKCFSKPNTHVFFGYYDITPFNELSDELIYLNLKEDEQIAHIMLNTYQNNAEQELAATCAWNWQQGCRLRWMPNNSREIVFNDFNEDGYVSRIINIDTMAERCVNAALYDISSDGEYGLSIDFERLGVKRPGYGYQCRVYNEDDHDLTSESIDIINVRNNTRKVILTYSDIIKVPGCESIDLRNNYINHLSFSPSGRKFLFFWLTADSSWHKAYLLVHDLEKCETKLLEGKEKVSHYVWIDDDNIICTAANDNRDWHYYMYNISSSTKTLMNPKVLNTDGHPSVFNNQQILTDTYPNLNGYQQLYIADIDGEGYEQLVDIYSNCKIEGEKRTDLHPRYNRNKKLVCFDSNQKRYRTLMVLSI